MSHALQRLCSRARRSQSSRLAELETAQEPTSAATQCATDSASCAGAPLSIPGSSGTSVVYGGGLLNVTSGGQTSTLPMPAGSQVQSAP